MAIKIPKFSSQGPSKIYQNWDFWGTNTYIIWQPSIRVYLRNNQRTNKLAWPQKYLNHNKVARWFVFKPKIAI
jgi:hypothetical protein